MLNIFKMPAGKRRLEEITEIEKNCWIDMENPSDSEIERVARETGIPEDFLKAPLDEEERAHIDVEDGVRLILVDIPIAMDGDKDDWYTYSTIPLAVIISDDYFVTVCIKNTTIVNEFIHGRVKNFDINKKTRFLYQLLYQNAVKFLHYLKQIDKSSNRVQIQLHKSMKNKELFQLLDLEKALVYFSNSLNANQVVIDKIMAVNFIKHYDDDKDILDDVVIENKQAIEMCTIYRDIMSGTMDAYASIISNNQNIVMKLLTAITIILSVPTLLASFWGMNTGVPLENSIWGFVLVAGISALITGILVIVFIKKKLF